MKKVGLLLSISILVAVLFTLDSCKKNENIMEKPNVDFSFTIGKLTVPCEVLFQNKTIGATSYTWDFGDGTTSKEINPKKTFSVEGNYSVTLAATGKRGTASLSKQILIEASKPEFSTFTDPRDGQTYKTVKIGKQWWFAQNLNYRTNNSSSFCYDGSPAMCGTYGRLYSWSGALSACPTGWHLPSLAEWNQLIDYLGGKLVAGGKMKSTTGWAVNTTSTNSSGFSALPGGYMYDLLYGFIGENGLWWSSTPYTYGNTAYYIQLNYNLSETASSYTQSSVFYSIRCVMD
jgi:uncharacterized protein (TIGR02145 family)